MFELRPNSECCDRDLPPQLLEARIGSRVCRDCAEGIFAARGPSCGAESLRRPVRPPERLLRHPLSTLRMLKPR
ncbi:MAG: DUF1272 domain-containing protein [Alphaproteobacteria bacterium]|nr:DUF1272 domain-containing protein [Alphaproteobacteria bacterium]